MSVTLPVAPERSARQRAEALERANTVRSHRKQLKAGLKCGERAARDVLLAPADEELSMRVFELLLAMPKVGRVKANKWLSAARVSPSKTLGGLTERQRTELAGLMRRAPAVRPLGVL